MNHNDFMSVAENFGIGSGLSIFYLGAPDQLGSHLLDAAKRLARFLKNAAPELGHRKCLEVVARGVGFPNWHAFQTLCHHFVEHYALPAVGKRPPVNSDIFEPLICALPLLVRIGEDLPPDTNSIAALEGLGQRLAIALEKQLPNVMDVIARLYGADTWSLLCNRKPEDGKAPLYVFKTNNAHDGEFDWSPACVALVVEMDELWQNYDHLSKEKQMEALRYVKAIVKKRPDFLEGCLALATITELDGDHKKSGPILEAAISQADRLIPSSYSGEISWYWMNNRFYHRLLFARMRWCAKFGLLNEAIELARRQMRLNVDDNLGVRISLPALLIANGDLKAALVSMQQMRHSQDWDDGHILLVASLYHLVAGETQEGVALFLQALFVCPAIRPLILNVKVPDIDKERKKWVRLGVPDMQMMWFDYCNVCGKYADKTEVIYIKLLFHADVISAESDLAALFASERDNLRNSHGSPDQSTVRWKERIMEIAQSLARQLRINWQKQGQ